MEPAAGIGESPDPPPSPPPEGPSPVETSSSSSSAASPGAQAPAPPGVREVAAAMEAVERDAAAIAESYASLFASLRMALSNVTSTSAENMECLGDVVGRLQESVLEASSKGNKYINSCLRLNEEMRGLESLAMQLFYGRMLIHWIWLSISCSAFPSQWIINSLYKVVRKLMHQIHALCISSKETSCRKYGVPCTTKG